MWFAWKHILHLRICSFHHKLCTLLNTSVHVKWDGSWNVRDLIHLLKTHPPNEPQTSCSQITETGVCLSDRMLNLVKPSVIYWRLQNDWASDLWCERERDALFSKMDSLLLYELWDLRSQSYSLLSTRPRSNHALKEMNPLLVCYRTPFCSLQASTVPYPYARL